MGVCDGGTALEAIDSCAKTTAWAGLLRDLASIYLSSHCLVGKTKRRVRCILARSYSNAVPQRRQIW